MEQRFSVPSSQWYFDLQPRYLLLTRLAFNLSYPPN